MENTQACSQMISMCMVYPPNIYTATKILGPFIDRNSCNCACQSLAVPCRRIPLNLANHTNAPVYLSSSFYSSIPYSIDLPSHTSFLPYHLRYPLHLTEVVHPVPVPAYLTPCIYKP